MGRQPRGREELIKSELADEEMAQRSFMGALRVTCSALLSITDSLHPIMPQSESLSVPLQYIRFHIDGVFLVQGYPFGFHIPFSLYSRALRYNVARWEIKIKIFCLGVRPVYNSAIFVNHLY